MTTTAVGAAVNAGLNLFLIPRYGRNGAAAAALLGELLTMVLLCWGLQPLFGRPGARPMNETPERAGAEFGNLGPTCGSSTKWRPPAADARFEIGTGSGGLLHTADVAWMSWAWTSQRAHRRPRSLRRMSIRQTEGVVIPRTPTRRSMPC